MAYDKLQSLGEGKFKKIVNLLMTGTPAQAVARTIRNDWGDLADTAEKTLTQQLNRLRIAMAKGAFGDDAKKVLEDPKNLTIKLLRNSNLEVLLELTGIAEMQHQRVQWLWDVERKLKKYNPHINPLVRDLQETLVQIQKIRFDLGLDEFKGVVPGVRGKVETAQLPDGTTLQRGMFEIISGAEAIIQRRLGASQ